MNNLSDSMQGIELAPGDRLTALYGHLDWYPQVQNWLNMPAFAPPVVAPGQPYHYEGSAWIGVFYCDPSAPNKWYMVSIAAPIATRAAVDQLTTHGLWVSAHEGGNPATSSWHVVRWINDAPAPDAQFANSDENIFYFPIAKFDLYDPDGYEDGEDANAEPELFQQGGHMYVTDPTELEGGRPIGWAVEYHNNYALANGVPDSHREAQGEF